MRIGYLVSRYPALSHAFIRREVLALRRRGLAVDTFTLRLPPASELPSAADQEERKRTFALLPVSPGRLLGAHLRALRRGPARYAGALGLACRHRSPGLRASLWALFHFAEAGVLAEELRRRGVGHLHVHFANAGAQVGLLAARLAGIGWSLSLHGAADFEGAERPLLGAKIAAAGFVRCVSCYGRAQAMWAADPVDWDKLFVARCGVQLPAAPSRPGRGDGRLRVLCVGRLSREKGHVGLLEAVAELRAGGVDAELRILGEGPERGRLEAAVRARGLAAAVSLPGAASEDQIAAALAESDVFALSSLMEGVPVVLMEAMARAVPVVAPRLAGIPELVEHERSGLLYTPACWPELAAQLARLAAPSEERERLGAEGRRRVVEQFELEHALEPLAERFERLAAGPEGDEA